MTIHGGKTLSAHSQKITLRQTLYTIIVKLTGKNAEQLADAAIGAMQHLKDQVKTIIFDNGLKFAQHERIAAALDADIYFATPYCS